MRSVHPRNRNGMHDIAVTRIKSTTERKELNNRIFPSFRSLIFENVAPHPKTIAPITDKGSSRPPPDPPSALSKPRNHTQHPPWRRRPTTPMDMRKFWTNRLFDKIATNTKNRAIHNPAKQNRTSPITFFASIIHHTRIGCSTQEPAHRFTTSAQPRFTRGEPASPRSRPECP